MIRRRLSFSGVKPVQQEIAFSLTLALGVIVFGMAVCVSAQVPGGGRGGSPPRRAPPTGGAPHGGTAEPQEIVGPADPDRGPPERKYDSLPVDTSLRKMDSKIRTDLRNGNYGRYDEG